MFKRIIKKIYNMIVFIFLKPLYKPIFKEINNNKIDKSLSFGIELLLRKEFMNDYNLLSPSKSIELIKTKKSFIRLGDGDLPILGGKNGGMHRFSEKLRNSLLYALDKANKLNIPIGINPVLVEKYTDNLNPNLFYACENLNTYDSLRYLSKESIYFDGLILRYSPLDLYLKNCLYMRG
ncbi:hypothetical protein [Helicobacter sp. MIT 14-3879]|uniref:hypothetical protein n=1 Tax=Helicobacter sp. MIT 14-3879 TaxID=2040649 RepID=UPI000E1E9F35|nr:hypothetical protein [Helicobacter sp. MIT 14-3879]RDU63933.1 hypothetical protein CQA44_04655 [Helicobacter sp. MIT 14-3879]